MSILLGYYEREINFQLLYQGSKHGFSAIDFHSVCDDKRGTMTIIKSEGGYVFGGFTSIEWNNSSRSNISISKLYAPDPSAFIFSLVNRHNTPVRMNVINSGQAIGRDPNTGPVFGSGKYIFIANDSYNSANSSSYVGNSYQLPESYFSRNESLAESTNFKVKEIEVFLIS